MNNAEFPDAVIVDVYTRRSFLGGGIVRIVEVACPFCHRKHTHGWPVQDGDADPGHRIAHCGHGSYEVVKEAHR